MVADRLLLALGLSLVLLTVVSAKKGHPWFYQRCNKFFEDPEDLFACRTNKGMCVVKSQMCDSVVDCLDGSDEDPEECWPDHEEYCDTGFNDKWIQSQPLEKWQCEDKMCIELCRVCDGEEDCHDASDEDPKLCKDKNLRQILDGVEYQCQRDGKANEL